MSGEKGKGKGGALPEGVCRWTLGHLAFGKKTVHTDILDLLWISIAVTKGASFLAICRVVDYD